MTVAQTSQLIQLILNTCLLMAIAVAWWGLVWMRYGIIANQLSQTQRQRQQGQSHLAWRSLHRQYRLGRTSIGVMHYVLLGQAGSLLALSLRTLLGADWLISLSMLLFLLAVIGLTLSVGLSLMEFYQAARPRRRSRASRRLKAAAPQVPLLPQVDRDRLAS